MRLAGWMCALLLWPSMARAEWLEASSPHFVVYADDNADNVRTFAERLERYHSAMEVLTREKTPIPSRSNRLTVYVVKSEQEVRELAKDNAFSLSAFYLPRAGGSIAIVPPQGPAKAGQTDRSLIMLLHEYAHHFSISTSSFPMPLWFTEGSAEFFASATFQADGGMELGLPANHRVRELFFASHITARDVLDTSTDAKLGGRYLGFYAKSWQLYHYLIFEPRRKGQFAQYIAEITAGRSSRDAALKAFGDLDALERELDEYSKRRTLLSFVLGPTKLQPSTVHLRTLTAGAAAIMPIRIRLHLGADDEQAPQLLDQARAIATRFPSDPVVLTSLAAAEHTGGNDRAAIAAADAAIAFDPAQSDAYVQKGLALFRIAEGSDSDPKAYAQARSAFAALSEREPDHPLPLIYAFRSYVAQGKAPPTAAMQGLERAVQLAPFDLHLRMNLAMQQARSGQDAAARANLAPIANNPHGGAMAEEARAVLARMNAESGSRGGGVEAKQDSGASVAESVH